MINILIIGASGFIGKNIIENFADERICFHLMDRRKVDISAGVASAIWVDINLFETERILGYIKDNKITHVVHLVSSFIPSSSANDFYCELDEILIPTFRLVEGLAMVNNDTTFIYFSSGGAVYGDIKDQYHNEKSNCEPISYYGLGKLYVEKYIERLGKVSDFKYLILRPTNPYGKYQNIYGKQGVIAVTAGKLIRGETPEIWGDGNAKKDYIFIADLCKILHYLITMNVKNLTLNIGSGKEISLKDLISKVVDKMPDGLKKDIKYLPVKKFDVMNSNVDVKELLKIIGDFEFTDIDNGIAQFLDTLNIE